MTNYKAFMKYLFSYIAVLFIPIVLISFFSYSQILNILRNEAIKSSTLMLEQTRDIMDSHLYNVRKLSSDISLNQHITYLLAKDNIDEVDTYPGIVNAIKELGKYKNSNSIIENIFIFLKEGDSILSNSSKYHISNFVEYTFKIDGMTNDELREMVRLNSKETILPYRSISTDNRAYSALLYLHPLPMDSPYPNAVLMMTINEEGIQSSMKKALGEYEGIVYITDIDNNIMTKFAFNTFSIDESEQKEVLGLIKDESSNSNYVTKDDLIVSFVKSQNNDWNYISVIPSSQILKKVNYVRQRIIVILAITLVIGFIAAYYFSRKNYINMEGISKIIQNYKKGADFKNDSDKWDYINHTIMSYISDHDVLQQKIYKQMPLIQHSFFNRLIKGEVTDINSIGEMLVFLGLDIKKDSYGIAILEIDNRNYNDFGKIEPIEEFIRVTLINVIEKFTDDNVWVYTLEDDIYRIAIIIGVSGLENAENDICSMAGRINETVKKEFGFTVTIGVGGRCSTLAELKNSYLEGRKALEYKMVMGTDVVISYDEICNRKLRKTCYSFRREKDMMSFIKMGKYEEIQKILDDIVHIVKSDPVSIDSIRCIYFDVINTAIKAVEELNIHDDNVEKYLEDLMQMQTVDEMYEVACSFYKTFCEHIGDAKASKNVKLRDNVLEYIQNNYWDNMLSVDGIASCFSISPSYLSRFIKDQTGYNISDYIHEVRLIEAKRLLETTEMTVAEIGDNVGYNSIYNFSRVFKRYENVTPTDYRLMCKNNK